MTAPDLTRSAADLGRDIAAGLDPVDLTEAYLDAIASGPDGIYARTTPDRARSEAEAARKRHREDRRLGPLDGVPISWKDLFDTKGVATESGCAMLQGQVPDRDAQVLTNGTAAGTICLGKTHMTELAFSGLGLNPVTATPPNRHGADVAPGGSSSGAAASVAYGLATAGIGSDTGGSVRVPAAWNDLVGFKTAHGDLTATGVVPLCEKFDTIGPLCRTVEDAALLYAALKGHSATALPQMDLSSARLMVLNTAATAPLDNAPQAAAEAAITRIAAAGAKVETQSSPAVDAALPLSGVLYTTEAYGIWGETIEARGDLMYQRIRTRFEAGQDHSGVDYVRAWRRLDELRRDWCAETEGFDAVVMPTVPILPPPVDQLLADEAFFTARNLECLRNTRVGNLMGLAAITLPTGTPSCGVMLLAHPGQEAKLLSLAAAVEKTLS
ncbi:amidase [Halovulum sp. GXIMD14793]